MNNELTERQQEVLDFIYRYVSDRGYPPSVRDIGEAIKLKSPSSTHRHVRNLERLGYIRRDPDTFRGIELLRTPDGEPMADQFATVAVPVVGEIAAGEPILADQQVEDHLPLPADFVGGGTLFALTVRGESMIEAGVLPGDTVVIRQQSSVEQGEMCAALIDGEATVKFFRRTGGQIFLDPANEVYEPIPVPPDAESAIMGRVVAVLRKL